MEKNILILTYWRYNDALVQTYTLPYIRQIKNKLGAGRSIYFVTLETDDTCENPQDDLFHHIPLKYHRFGIRAILGHFFNFFFLKNLMRKKNIGIVHTWCTPAGGMGYLLTRFTPKKLILDSFEPHAEPMIESGTWKKNGIAHRILFWLEKKQAQHAYAAIACVPEMQEYALNKYGACPAIFYSKPACVDHSKFNLDLVKNTQLISKYDLSDKIVCVYAGKFGGSYLTQEVFDFFKVADNYWKGGFKMILLNNHTKEEVHNWCELSGVNIDQIIHEFKPHDEVPMYMGLADFAITPFIPVPSKRYGSPIKTGEYWSLGLPVVITKNISDNSEIIKTNNIGAVLEGLNEKAYQNAIIKIDQLLKEDRDQLRSRIRNVSVKYRSFEISDRVYQELYSQL